MIHAKCIKEIWIVKIFKKIEYSKKTEPQTYKLLISILELIDKNL